MLQRPMQIDRGKCGRYHFCRLIVDVSIRREEGYEVIYIENKVVGEGIARRDDSDLSCDEIGETLALSRAAAQLSRRLDKKVWGQIRFNDRARRQRAKKINQNKVEKPGGGS